MASIEMNEEQCKNFIDDIFIKTVGVGFDYAVQAVKEKMEREANRGCPANNTKCNWLQSGRCTCEEPQLVYGDDRFITCMGFKEL